MFTARSDDTGRIRLGHFYGQPVTATPVDWQAIQTEQLESSFRDREVRAASARAVTTPGSPSIYEFHVDTTGLYRVTYEDLRAAGLDLQGIPVEQIALTNRANKIPIRVEAGTTSGVFGPGGFIEFLGEALDTLYTTVNVYRLEIDRHESLTGPQSISFRPPVDLRHPMRPKRSLKRIVNIALPHRMGIRGSTRHCWRLLPR